MDHKIILSISSRMVSTFVPHHFQDVFSDLINNLELTTLRRLLNVVAAKETHIISTLMKSGNTLIPREALELYSMQYALALPEEHALAAANVSLFILYAQVFNESYEKMQESENTEHRNTLKRYIINLFEEMTSRFLDDRIIGDSGKICRSEGDMTCHSSNGFCMLRVILGLTHCTIKFSDFKTRHVGEEIFACVSRYMEIVSSDALNADPHAAGFATPIKAMLDKNDERENVLQNLLTPYEAVPELNPDDFDNPNSARYLNENMLTMTKFAIHVIMETRFHGACFEEDECYKLFIAFIGSIYNISLSDPCRAVLWGKVYDVCFKGVYVEQEANMTLIQMEELIQEKYASKRFV